MEICSQFSPVGANKSTKTNSSYVGENVLVKSTTFEWKVHPWGRWEVVAKGDGYECVVTGACEQDLTKCKTTVLRAPAPDTESGMLPLCRETFSGDMTVSLYKINAKKEKTDIRKRVEWFYRLSGSRRRPLGSAVGNPSRREGSSRRRFSDDGRKRGISAKRR